MKPWGTMPKSWGPRELLTIAQHEWDRVIIGLFFIGFGVTDFLTPDITNPSGFLEIFRVSQFILAGLLYIAGVLFKSYVMRGLATVLYSFGLLTIAVIISLGSGSPTLWLIAAFALQGFADLRRLKSKNDRESVTDVITISRRARKRSI